MYGHYLNSRFDFKTTRSIAKIATLTLDLSANTHVHGLAYSYVEIRKRSIGMDMRLWILATPVDGTLFDVSLVAQVREIRIPKRWLAGLEFLPVGDARALHEQAHCVSASAGSSAG